MHHTHLSKKFLDACRKEIKEIDVLMLILNILGPLATIPQLVLIYVNQSAHNISLLTWVLYATTALIGLLYGIVHKLRPLIIGNILWLLVQGGVVVGILLYQ